MSADLPPITAGVDLGTSGCRAAWVDGRGRLLAQVRRPWPDGELPHDPGVWWRVAAEALAELAATAPQTARRIAAVAVDGTSGTVVLCTPDGAPLTPARRYDEPAAPQWVAAVERCAPANSGAHGNGSGLARALELIDEYHPPPPFLLLSQADWIGSQLCGRFGWSDANNALKLGYDPVANGWPASLAALELPSHTLPTVYPPGASVGTVTPCAARLTGLPAGCRVAAGTTDSIAGFLAATHAASEEAAPHPDAAVTSLGTTLVLKRDTPNAIFSPRHGVYSHRLGERFLVGGASNSGAGVLAHFFSAEQIAALSAEIDPERDTGLDYYPLVRRGERFPDYAPDRAPRITPRPKSDLLFLQGLMEGVAAIEAAGYRRLTALGAPAPKRVISVGGGAANPAWRRIRERYLGVPVLTANAAEAAIGAARLAQWSLP